MNLVMSWMTDINNIYTNSYDTNVTHYFENLVLDGFQRCSIIEWE